MQLQGPFVAQDNVVSRRKIQGREFKGTEARGWFLNIVRNILIWNMAIQGVMQAYLSN